jgi:hypothetical protein
MEVYDSRWDRELWSYSHCSYRAFEGHSGVGPPITAIIAIVATAPKLPIAIGALESRCRIARDVRLQINEFRGYLKTRSELNSLTSQGSNVEKSSLN